MFMLDLISFFFWDLLRRLAVLVCFCFLETLNYESLQWVSCLPRLFCLHVALEQRFATVAACREAEARRVCADESRPSHTLREKDAREGPKGFHTPLTNWQT